VFLVTYRALENHLFWDKITYFLEVRPEWRRTLEDSALTLEVVISGWVWSIEGSGLGYT